jgi:hypothetical protein
MTEAKKAAEAEATPFFTVDFFLDMHGMLDVKAYGDLTNAETNKRIAIALRGVAEYVSPPNEKQTH